MSNNSEIPLYVYQVLEEEYESLHGTIREKVTTYLPNPEDGGEPLEVESKRDWGFHKGHIKRPEVLAEILGSDAVPRRRVSAKRVARHAGPTDVRMSRLKKHLRARIGDVLKGAVSVEPQSSAGGEFGDAYEAALMQRLNELLKEPDLFWEQSEKNVKGGRKFEPGKERFAYGWLTDETRGLLALLTSGVSFGTEDVKHLNRLLLEDTFPDIFQKAADVRLAAVYTLFHEEPQAALSLSGGGIRSGTFALGLIQGLARHGLLQKFDYLSTVSGGGYIGSWLTGWIHRHPEGLAGVSRDLAYGGAEKVDPDPAPLRYLRRYSNFITPKVGLLTADTWTFAGIYLRNTLLNWLVFVPLIISALMIPRVLLALTLMQEVEDRTPLFHLPWWFFNGWSITWLEFQWRHVFLTLGVLLGSWALAYVIFNKPGVRARLEERRPWFRGKTGQGGFLFLCLLPLLVSAFCLTTYFAWSREVNEGHDKPIWGFWLFGLTFTLVGWLMASAVLKRIKTEVTELAGVVGVGLLGGTIFYALSQVWNCPPDSACSPVIGYSAVEKFNWLTTNWAAWRTEVYICLAVPLFLLVFLIATFVFVGLTSTPKIKFVEDEDREWWARFGAWLLISIIVWVAANVVVIFGPVALLTLPKLLGALGGISGVITLLAGRSSKTPAAEGAQAQPSKLASLMGSLLPLFALIFVVFIIAAFSLATSGLFQTLAFVAPWLQDKLSWFNPDWLTNVNVDSVNKGALTKLSEYEYYKRLIYSDIPHYPRTQAAQLAHMNVLHHTWMWFVLALGLALLIFGVALARIINLNIFSLHGGYRNRLIRGFLGASRPDHERRPNPFTGFDPSDNLHMHELRHALLAENDFDESRLSVLIESLKDATEEVSASAAVAKAVGEGALKGAAGVGVRATGAAERTHEENVRLLSRLLVRHEKFEGVAAELKDYDSKTPVTSRLIASLRSFLNEVIEEEPLYEQDFASGLLQKGYAPRIQEQIRSELRLKQKRYAPPPEPSTDAVKKEDAWVGQSLRTDYQLLLNRLVIEEAYEGAIKPCVSPPYKLMHVVNTTLNLVGGSNLAWQQRKAEPFSVSPLHSGCFRVGYRNSRDYGGRATNGISLGTAVTASGAAASSNMGYYTTSPLISLLLTLFNVRLGLWLGNPGPHGQKTYQLGAPTLSFKPVLSEAFGMTDDTNPYVYLTDGGHFENLALYEMVLRRCHFIVVSDGAQDEEFRFGDLGNAVRKIRIDLGVPIDFWDVPIYPKAPPAEEGSGVYWALAKIRYTCVDKGPGARDGVLLYIKPTVYGDEPRDVLEYKKSFPAFPHQSTGDQFFDEPQFESYRMLGSHIMDSICGEGHENLELDELICKAFERLKEAKPQKLEEPFRLNASFLTWMEAWCMKPDAAVKTETPASSAPDAAHEDVTADPLRPAGES
jgi:hypothetical protein